MRAPLDDPAVLHHQDHVGVADRRQPVRDDERRAPAHQLAHRALDEDFGARVDAARRFVEDQDRRIGEERARDRQQLLLALRQVARLLVDRRVVVLGQRPDEVIGLRRLRRLDDRLVARVRSRRRRRCSRESCRRTATCPAAPCRTCGAARRASARGCRRRPRESRRCRRRRTASAG